MKQIQIKNLSEYNSGKLMLNKSQGGKSTSAFKFNGHMYISKAVKRNKKYSFDDRGWYSSKISIFGKVLNCLKGSHKKAVDCKKSRAVGV